MTIRGHYGELQHRAASILDDIRAGIHHELRAINWALRMLGEPVDPNA